MFIMFLYCNFYSTIFVEKEKDRKIYLSYITVLPSTVPPFGQPSKSFGEVNVIWVKSGLFLNASEAKLVNELGSFERPVFVNLLLSKALLPIVFNFELLTFEITARCRKMCSYLKS